MNEFKKQYEEKKERILSLLQEAENFYRSDDMPDKEETFAELARTLRDNEFSVVVVGEFSAGKSTFLNALMGENILPSFTNETTATVNFLKHSSKAPNGEAGIVYYSDGTTQPIEHADIDTISKYVSTKSEVDVAHEIEHLDLFLDSDFLKDGVMLVDSPGLNGLADNHREITETQIERSSASIFMFRAEQPGSKSDFEFLHNLKSKVNTIIFVLNKIDNIKASEGETPESVIEKLKTNYSNQFPKETKMPEIMGISAYEALVARSDKNLDYRGKKIHSEEEKKQYLKESRFEDFEKRLWRFLSGSEKTYKMLLAPVERTINLLSNDKHSFEEEISVLSGKTDTEELQEKIIELKKQAENAESRIKEVKGEVSSSLDSAVRDMKESITSGFEQYKQRQCHNIDTWESIDDYEDYVENIDSRVQRDLKRIVGRLEQEFYDGIRDVVSTNYSEVASNVNSVMDSNEIKISFSDSSFEDNRAVFRSGMDEYDNKIAALKEERKKIADQLDEAEINKLEAYKLETKLQHYEEEIERRKSEQQIFMRTYAPPAREYTTVTESIKEKRKGFFGGIANILLGEKTRNVPRTYDNQEEIEEYKRQFAERRKYYDDDIKQSEAKLADLEKNKDKEPEIYELKVKELERKQMEMNEELKDYQKQFFENFKSRQRSFLKKQQNNISDYIDDVTDNIIREFNKEIANSKNNISDMICNVISGKLREELDARLKEQRLYESRLKESEQNKNERIKRLTEIVNKIDEILKKAIPVQTELLNSVPDSVEQDI